MTNIINFPEQSSSKEEASIWLARLDSGLLTSEEANDFSNWVSASSQNRDAIVELCRLWDNMEVLSELSVLLPYDEKAHTNSRQIAGRFKRPSLILSSMVALLLLSIILLPQLQSVMMEKLDSMDNSGNYEILTLLGEHKDIQLADGSMIHLNTDSRITVNFTNKQRGVELIKGEVFFEVAHQSDRPFLVYTGAEIVRAVGTAFLVRLNGDGLEVTVTEGKVEVSSAITDVPGDVENFAEIVSNEYLTTLGKGQMGEFEDNKIQQVITIEPEAVSRKLSWQHGMLEFKGETLEEVVREISRYTDKKIIIADQSIRDIRMGGYFKTGEVETLLTVLKNGFRIAVDQTDENLIFLRNGGATPNIRSN